MDDSDIECDFSEDIILDEKNTINNIVQDLQPLGLPENIIIRANQIINENRLINIKRRKKNEILYYCVYRAYQDLQIPVDPLILSQLFNINKRKIAKCFNQQLNIDVDQNNNLDTKHFVSYYLKRLDNIINVSENDLFNIIKIYKFCVENDGDFSDNKPQIIAKALIYYYYRYYLNNQQINPKKIASIENRVNFVLFQRIVDQINDLVSQQ